MAAWRMDGKPRTARRFTVYKNCPLPTPEDRLFFVLTSLKTYTLQVVQGACLVWCRASQSAQFIGDCSSSKWSKHVTNSPFLALLAMDGSKAAYKIISACSNAVS